MGFTLENAHKIVKPRGQVLVVEDDTDVSDMVAEVLREEGFQVDTAADGCTALDQALAIEPRLIFLDLQMPRMDGRSFVDELRKRALERDAKIVLVSASAQLAHEAERLEVEGYLRKPFSLAEVVELTHRFCGD